MKNINFENLEILSPAGNPDSFIAALNSGADAIYLGLDLFNARMSAENFTTENIRTFIKLAHSHFVKVYITINTLLKDEDFDKLVELVDILTKAKADAFIVQDLGVAFVLKKCFNNIVLHASTQMGIHNLEGALVAEKIGFSRIVLSRETTLEDIKEISEKTNLELEYFIQGALCVAFSGNCYLSSIEHSASGNEGKCLQLCRLPYKSSLTNQEKYYLSPKDLSLIENLPLLIDAGITSFKIEGRLKHSGYVSICTKLYKTALNLIKNNNFTNNFIKESDQILRTTFSRGEFNKSAYLFKNNENYIINSAFQNHIGIKIGKVESVKTFKNNLFKIQISSSHRLSNGDGLKFFDKNNKQISSIGVGNPTQIAPNKYEFVTKHNLQKDLTVHLIQNSKIEEEFLNQKIKQPLSLEIFANKFTPLKIISKTNNIEYIYTSDFILEEASKKPLSHEDFEKQFSKTNDSIFFISEIKTNLDSVFVPTKLLNEARRQILDIMQEQIIEHNEKHLKILFDKSKYELIKQQKTAVSSKNYEIINKKQHNDDNLSIKIISPNNYLDLTDNENKELFSSKNIALMLPVITNYQDKKIINKIINNLEDETFLFSNNIGGLYYKIFKNKNLIISPLMNIKNKFAILFLNELGIKNICASIEASANFANKNNLAMFCDGEFPLMTFAHCPYLATFENSCTSCKFNNKLSYKSQSNKTYKIKRVKISKCYFYLMKHIQNKNFNYSLKNLKND